VFVACINLFVNILVHEIAMAGHSAPAGDGRGRRGAHHGRGAEELRRPRGARQNYELSAKGKRAIKDGLTNTDDIISDDGQVGNPKIYTTASTSSCYTMRCVL
jgi:hypothetical protein